MLFRFFMLQVWTLAFIVLSAAQVFAAEGDQLLSLGQIGVAHEVRWGTSIAQAKSALPNLSVTEDHGPFDPRLARIGTATVSVSGCALDFTLKFFRDQLDDLRIQSKAGGDCHEQLERYLTGRYNDPYVPAPCPNIIVRRWQTTGTAVSYDHNCVPSRTGMELSFVELTDRSGRKAYSEYLLSSLRSNHCNVIDVEILPGATTEDALDPVLDSELRKLGCDPNNYPAISFRLQESASPVVNLRVAEDGSVENVALVTASGRPRLDEAAIKLAQQKLKFLPATRAGQPVAATRQIRITFITAGPMAGTVCMCYAIPEICKDTGWFQPSYCRRRVPSTIATLAPRGRPRLYVTSSDITKGVLTVPGDISPALMWTAGPAGTRSYVVISEENRIVRDDPEIYWVMFDIPSSVKSLPQGIPHDLRIAVAPGAVNAIVPHSHYGASPQNPGYRHGVAHNSNLQTINLPVRFQVFALDTKLNLDPLDISRSALIDAMKGHVLASGEITTDGTR